MITVKQFDKSDLVRLVRLSYLGDDEGIFKFHVEPLGYEEGVVKTVSMIEQMEAHLPMKYYEVLYNGMEIGYYVFYKEILYSFGINIAYRTKKNVLTDWWRQLKKSIGCDFGCVLQSNNTRAINFLKRLGMDEAENCFDADNLVTLINNN